MSNDIWNNLLAELFSGIITIAMASLFVILVRRNKTLKAMLEFWRGSTSVEQKASLQVTFSQRLEKLTGSLVSASEEFDKVLSEMNQVANDRKLALTTLETQVAELSSREVEMKKKVTELEKVSIPALEYFIQATEKGERRSAKRDYILFIAGVIVSAIVSIVLRFAFGI